MNFHEGIKTEQTEREEQRNIVSKETWIVLCILNNKKDMIVSTDSSPEAVSERVTLIRASFFATSSSPFHEYMQQSYKLLNHPDNNGKQIVRKRGKRDRDRNTVIHNSKKIPHLKIK